MKNYINLFLLVLCFTLGTSTVISCNNPGGNSHNGTTDSLNKALDAFKSKTSEFDSSWNDKLQQLNERIAQWDSSAETQTDALNTKMQREVDKIKQQRDSLKMSLKRTNDQSTEKWNDFKQSVSDKYSAIVDSLQELGK